MGKHGHAPPAVPILPPLLLSSELVNPIEYGIRQRTSLFSKGSYHPPGFSALGRNNLKENGFRQNADIAHRKEDPFYISPRERKTAGGTVPRQFTTDGEDP
jgi:hypothetical protein